MSMGQTKECEVCGREVYKLIRREIEGVLMYVCSDCQDMGDEPEIDKRTRARAIKKDRNTDKFKNMYGSSGPSPKYKPKSNRTSRSRKPRISNLKIVDDAPEILLKHRNKMGLSAKDFAQSVLIKDNYYKRIEKGTTSLTIEDARKFEKKYHLKLVVEEDVGEEPVEEISKFLSNDSKPAESVVYFRKRGQKPEYDQ